MITLTKPAQLTLDGAALLGYCGFIFWLSDQSRLPTPQLFSAEDKLHHFLAYFVMCVAAWRFFRHWCSNRLMLMIISLVFCSLYGISDEWHQSFVPGRQASVLDWLADTAGGLIAALSRWRHGRTETV